MIYTAKITNVEKVRHQATNSNFLEVAFTIIGVDEETKETVPVAERRIGLDPKATVEQIREEVAKYAETYGKEQAQAIVQAEQDKEDQHVEDIRKELLGKELNNKENDA